MLFVMPSQRSSVLIFAAIHLSSFLRSLTTDPASLILRRRAEKDSDFPTCGPAPKNWVHNSMFELRRVAAPASSFSYRSIDELCSLWVWTRADVINVAPRIFVRRLDALECSVILVRVRITIPSVFSS